MRSTRLAWIVLVVCGSLLVCAAIALGLASLCLSDWVRYRVSGNYSSFDSKNRNRGLFHVCLDDHSACEVISEPVKFENSICSSKSCFAIIFQRLFNWGVHVASLAVKVVVTLACIIVLCRIRFGDKLLNPQTAQICLTVCGFFLWFSGILSALSNVMFQFTLTFEKVSTNTKLKGVYADITRDVRRRTTEMFGICFVMSWVGAVCSLLGGWFWLIAAYMQRPASLEPAYAFHSSTSSSILVSKQDF